MSRDCLTVANVLRDVLDPFRALISLRASYGEKLIYNGSDWRTPAIANRPRVDVGGEDLRVSYTLVMIDPDAPSPSNPSLREYLHWLVTDIPATTDARFGRELVCYESPKPSHGIHRIVLVLFQQMGRETVFAPAMRQNFNTRMFAQEYNLGQPVAATYFHCQRPAGSGGPRLR
ncbi:Protein flowering locus T [Apostasia shenzhenica]|uniref:Protein flowering locus T n=1 Tax=Apostasia shenzhenica TaxID=1088818 RepID=A0A2I0A7Z8_9ASPA|nr:Protein flowering locus T [Apostasia shenzhenica]